MIDKPGIYTIPLQDYINDPCPVPSLSASIAHALVTQSPKHAWMKHPRLNPNYEREDTSQTDIGSIAHAMLLENDASRVVIVEAEDWRTKAAKEARDNARVTGKLPILRHKVEQVKAMVKAAHEAIKASEVAQYFKEGKPEQTLIIGSEKLWIRSRPDWLTNDYRVILDYKTTQGSAEPSSWMRNVMLPIGYDLQAHIGIRCVNKLCNPQKPPAFVFMVQETEPPYAMSFIGLTPQFLELAAQKMQRVLNLWQMSMHSNKWPSYPSRIAYLEPPAWLQMEMPSEPVKEEI